jgi:D-alanyl-D-alanine carboxypeptidase
MNYVKLIAIALALTASSLTAGCGGEEPQGMDAGGTNVPVQTAPAKPASQPQRPADAKPDDKAPALTAIAFADDVVALAPGERYRVELVHQPENAEPGAALTDLAVITTSDESVVRVEADGTLVVADDAEIGSVVVAVAQVDELTAELTVHVKYSLEATVQPNPKEGGIPVVTNPDHIAVLVNKERSLPDGFVPNNLVVPDVPFSFAGEHEKKQLQEPAARALEELFAAAAADGIELNAVSGYRSFATQTAIFNWNLKNQGEEHTLRYSARPGTSEHQTGLAMDVSSPSVGNVLEDVFGESREGKWLAEHCAEFGFIIRYPQGKEDITGYAYEPWHLRYVGKTLAKVIMDNGLTMEEYFSESIPVAVAR